MVTSTSCMHTISNEEGNGAISDERKRPIGYRCLEMGEKVDTNSFRMPCSIMKWDPHDYFYDPRHIEMCNAIEYEEYEKIETLLSFGIDINACGKGNMTFLFWGLPNGVKMFEFLLKKGADPNIVFDNDIVPKDLMFFSSVGACIMTLQEEYTKLFLKYGGCPHLVNSENSQSLLFYIIGNDDLDIVRQNLTLLSNAGADINHRDNQGKTLLTASQRWQIWILLLELGVDYRIPDNEGKTIIEMIVRESEFLKNKQRQYEQSILPFVIFFSEKEGIDLSLHGNDYNTIYEIMCSNIVLNEKVNGMEQRKSQRKMLNEYYEELWGNHYRKWLAM